MVDENSIRALRPRLDERGRRLFAAAEAQIYTHVLDERVKATVRDLHPMTGDRRATVLVPGIYRRNRCNDNRRSVPS
jgi:hypothetical protein